ncbi:hypothetical protein OIU34_24645 [Pararhizobium sp. BT-229]|uniref:hypothetical protein n=1 Tax=Pararhizobium sp. BT-229 TaxID=2986923 RepID=UPI0021F70B37|nr:hypothetical protein [Pararhizobium sp. BT-229]MCV9965091.1 hypothetical protein [Pararhizobium sp. BT-229]
MSTTSRVSNFVNLPATMVALTMLAACATAWSGSTSAGGAHDEEIAAVVDEVSRATSMTQLCKAVGRRLAETAVSRKMTELRPTRGLWEGKEDKAASAWEAARCPTAALVGIAYGTSQIANIDRRNRIAKAELD